MRITITIDADGAAFYELCPVVELVRILRSLADAAERAPDAADLDGRAIIDANGNRCGVVRIGGAQ
jgi:hypothetical protein